MLKFLDFDGVIVDSIEECYIVSKGVYFGYSSFLYDEEGYKALFYKYRGLVRPAYEYLILHEALEIYIQDKSHDIHELFKEILIRRSDKDKEFYEKEFFHKRHLYQNDDFPSWIAMNPLMSFGKTLIGTDNSDVYIVTTKNKEATKALLDYYKIKVAGIYANDEIKSLGSKGKLIKSIMNEKNEQEAFFLDDAVEHLETIKDDRVKCFFADWGYGKNSSYDVYKY
jgi:hypothetical protein